jgi:hypothetical protein
MRPKLLHVNQKEIAMRILLATAMMAGFAASSAYAECLGPSNTTAQSKAPVIVAQNFTTPAETIDNTLTGSIEDEDLRKKRLILETQVQ